MKQKFKRLAELSLEEIMQLYDYEENKFETNKYKVRKFNIFFAITMIVSPLLFLVVGGGILPAVILGSTFLLSLAGFISGKIWLVKNYKKLCYIYGEINFNKQIVLFQLNEKCKNAETFNEEERHDAKLILDQLLSEKSLIQQKLTLLNELPNMDEYAVEEVLDYENKIRETEALEKQLNQIVYPIGDLFDL